MAEDAVSVGRHDTPSRDDDVLHAWPRRGPVFFFWIVNLLALCLYSGFYIFDTHDFGDFLAWTAKLSILLIPHTYLFIAASIVLFTWKPILTIGDDWVAFAFLGLTIHREEVRKTVPQHNGLTENWRVAIELKNLKFRRFRALLLYPTAFTLRNTVYIWPMYLAEPRREIRDAIVEALSPRDRFTAQGPRS